MRLVSLNALKIPKDALGFFTGVSKLAARARARGEFDAAGDPIWSINEWKAFCRGAREYAHLQMFGIAIVNTVHEVEACIEDGYDAESIHNILKAAELNRELKNSRRDPGRMWYEEPAS